MHDSQAVMEGRVGFATGSVGVQAAAGGTANSSRVAPDHSNWMQQQQYQPFHAPVSSEAKASSSSKGGLKSKQQQPAAALPPVNHLFGTDGCLRSHLIQEVPMRLASYHLILLI